MALSQDLISQFAKVTKDTKKTSKEGTVFGTVVIYNGKKYVKIDGSELLTPVSTTADISQNDRVIVNIKDHSATVTGNVTSPSAKKDVVDEIGNQITEFEIVIADKVSVKDFDAQVGRIDELTSDNIVVKEKLTATEAEIKKLKAEDVEITGKLTATEAEIENIKAKKLDVDIADIKYATIEKLEATDAKIHNLEADYGDFKDLTTDKFTATDAEIKNLDVEKLSAKDAEIKYANIDFANIGEAAIKKLFSDSGIIKDLIVSDGHITGELVGVTIKGDLIEAGTVKADKLVVKGSDGLYYKLNVSAEKVESHQTDQNSLNGSIITAKSITASKVMVDDLVAFDATIGGFNITKESLYSGAKSSALNTTRGVYMDREGQLAIGDASNFLRYFKDSNGKYKLELSANSITMNASGKDLESTLEETIISSVEEFYQSSSPTELSGGSWSKTPPVWVEGKYVWRRTLVTYGDGSVEYTPNQNGVCITGNTGAEGPAGKGIKSTTITYQASTSGTTPPTGNWSSTIPSVTRGQYLWSRTVITYTDNKSSTSYSVAYIPKNGDNGTAGEAGTGVDGIVQQYYLSTSKTSQTGGEWIESMPTWTSGKFLWTRYKITYKNPVSTDYTSPICDSSWEAINELQVGGRNLFKNTSDKEILLGGYPTSSFNEGKAYESSIILREKDYILSFYAKSTVDKDKILCFLYSPNTITRVETCQGRISTAQDGNAMLVLSTEWTKYWIKYEQKKNTDTETKNAFIGRRLSGNGTGNVYIKSVKLEVGNKATDWSPAPEDVNQDIQNAQSSADKAQGTADTVGNRVTVAESQIKQLSDSISTLVTDENGTSLMTQTSNGWQFNIGAIQNTLNDARDKLDEMSGSVNGLNETTNKLDSLINDITKKTAYINMATDSSGKPCIELGKVGDPFKVRITNTSVDFIEGSSRIAYISNNALNIEKAIIKNELQIGDNSGFIWKKRSNGNLGLRRT